MPAEHPDQLRRWWWKSPLAARLLPAAALLTATGAGAISALPAGEDLATAPQPPRAPVSHLAPVTTSTTPPTTMTTTEPEPTAPPSTTTTTSNRPTTSHTPTTTTQQPQPPGPANPPGHNGDNGRPRPTTSTSTDDWVPVVTEGERCSREGDFGRTSSGAAASCERADDGKLRWTTQW